MDKEFQTETPGQNVQYVPVQMMSGYDTDDEIDLVELLRILWRGRWFVLGVVCCATAVAMAYVFWATPQYQVRSIISPGVVGFSGGGVPIRGAAPEDINSWFSNEGYLPDLLPKYGREGYVNGTLPSGKDISCSPEKNGNSILLSFHSNRPSQGMIIMEEMLQSLAMHQKSFAFAVENQEKKILNLKNSIENISIEKASYAEKIQQKKNRNSIIDVRIRSLKEREIQQNDVIKRVEAQIDVVHENTKELMMLRKSMVEEKEDRFSNLMYSNIVQQNISYSSSLEQRLDSLKQQLNEIAVQREKILVEKKDIQSDVKQLELHSNEQIAAKRQNLEQKLAMEESRLKRMAPLEIVSPPAASIKPVKPKKTLIVALTAVGSGFLGVLLVFVREAISKMKQGSKTA